MSICEPITHISSCLEQNYLPIWEHIGRLISNTYKHSTAAESERCCGVHFSDDPAFEVLSQKCLLKP